MHENLLHILEIKRSTLMNSHMVTTMQEDWFLKPELIIFFYKRLQQLIMDKAEFDSPFANVSRKAQKKFYKIS